MTMNQQLKQGNYITQAWLVILLALLYGSALAGVHVGLSDRIEHNKRNEIYSQIPNLVPDAVQEKTQEKTVQGLDGKTTIVYQACDAKGQCIGWVLRGSGQGFADRIELLVGIDPTLSSITGMYVLDQKETPGLGNYITDPERFQNQFATKKIDPPLVVVKSDPDPQHEILAITGATISSESVSDTVNKTIANLKQPILDLNR
ncbi:MAG: FMN-binding protein [Pirellulales bacterium]|nr:FMN-binding protein [Pirellulales bacterium]